MNGERFLNELTGKSVDRGPTVLDLFRRQVTAYPEKPAVKEGSKSYTYAELDRLSDRICQFLHQSGFEHQFLVPVIMDRTYRYLSTILGIAKSGKAFVPLHPEWPERRIAKLLEELDAPLLITDGNFHARSKNIAVFPFAEAVETASENPHPVVPVHPDTPAYILYTSGSTGSPKGVQVSHRQLYGATQNRIHQYPGIPHLLLIPPLTFDASLAAIFWPLCTGGSLVMSATESIRESEELPSLLAGTNTLLCVPSYYRFLLEEGVLDEQQQLERVILGGETVPKSLALAHFRQGRQVRLYNEYGPTEATIWATVEEITPEADHIAIGKPLPGVSCYVLDPETAERLPAGASGELAIGGSQVAQGYWKDPALTAARFLPDPFSKKSGARLYATGDRVRMLPDGRFVFEGRNDRQVKFQGNRIDLAEIEQVLLDSGRVKEALALIAEPGGTNPQLLLFIVPKEGLDITSARQLLRQRLPAYMIPGKIVCRDQFPLTENGKLDRDALLGAPSEARKTDRNSEEEWQYVAEAVGEVLGVPAPDAFANFFEAGGSSLAAMRLVARLNQKYKVALRVSDVFDHPTIAKLHEFVRTGQAAEPAIAADGGSPRHPKMQAPTTTFYQQSLWLVDQLEGSLAYHLQAAYLLTGKLHVPMLEAALRAIVKKHKALRTCFLGIDRVQLKSEADWKLSLHQSSEQEFSESLFQAGFTTFFQEPFDLREDFMVRGRLVSYGSDRHVLGLVFHHIAFDDRSMKIFLRELSENYLSLMEGRPLSAAPDSAVLPVLAPSQHHAPEDPVARAYWEKALAGWETLQLPKDYPQVAAAPRRAGILRFSLDREEIEPIRTLAKENQASLYMTFLALFKVLLYRYTHQVDLCVGSPVLDRNFPGSEEQIGYFINPLPLRSRIRPEDTFEQFLQAIKKGVRDALAHAHFPFIKLVERFSSGHQQGKPFFNTLFVMHEGSAAAKNLYLPEVGVRSLQVDPIAATYDLTFSLAGEASGLQGSIEYDAGQFRPDTIARMLHHFRYLLQNVSRERAYRVRKMSLLSSREIDALSGREQLPTPPEHRSFLDRFGEQVARMGPATALLAAGEQVDFYGLDQRANRLADWLILEGVREGDNLVLLAERGIDMVAAIVGIWRAGAAYVPVDPAYPRERIAYIIADCGASHLLVDEASIGLLDSNHPGKILRLQEGLKPSSRIVSERPVLSPDQRAYLIYTSGSTGKPKGVCLTQANLAAFLDWCGKEFTSESYRLMYAVTSVCFDLSVFELFFPLAYGKPVRILQNGLEIPEYLPKDEGVLINTVPSLVQKLLEEKVDLSQVALLNMAGEPIPEQLASALDLDRLAVRNLYGPTEDTTYSTCERLLPGRTVSIGRPISGTYVYILNADLMPCPVGVPGEIYLGGSGLAGGYWQRPGLTAEKFIPDPLAKGEGKLVYKTGDRGVWRADGKIDFLGRLDNQVKVNGYRIELDEIASSLRTIPGVANAAVVLQKRGTREEKVLAGFFTADRPLDTGSVMEALERELPRYMLPATLSQLHRFPLTPNGKIDRKQLEQMATDVPEQGGFIPPASVLESNLLDIWRSVLPSKESGVRDNFFLSGGNSLLALRLLGRIKESLGLEISVRELFAHPTVSAMADLLSNKEQKDASQVRILPRRPRPDKIPLSFGQESLWLTDKLEGSSQYHIPVLLKLTGETRSGVLQEAIRSILERHEVLRTVIKERGEEASQQVLPVLGWELEEAFSISGAPYAGWPDRDMIEFLERPFDLGKDFMIRAKKYPLHPDACLLLVVVHHISFDGWSIPVFLNELFALVKAEKTGESLLLPHLKIQYADYALWQRNRLSDAALEGKLRYWKEKLRGIRPLNFHEEGDFSQRKSHEGAIHDIPLGPAHKNRLQDMAKQLGMSPFMILLAGFKALLERNSGQQDLCVGTAMGGRNQTETEPLIGYFVNPLPIRSYLNPNDSFQEILLEVKKNVLEAFEHQEVPFEKIVAATAQHRQFGVNPLFQVMFVMEYADEVRNTAPGLSMEVQTIPQTTAKFDLTFLVQESNAGIRIRMEYSREIFDGKRIENLASQYLQILESGMSNPTQKLSQMVQDPSCRGIGKVETSNGIRQQFVPIQRMITRAAIRNGKRTAVFFGTQELTFDDLNAQANRLAAHLLAQGVTKGKVVGIVLPRSPEFVVAILGILKAGAAYLPLDPELPAQRIGFMLDDSRSFFLTRAGEKQLSTMHAKKMLWEEFLTKASNYPNLDPEVDSLPEDPAYVIYTSGTTGKPKGVVLEHLNLFHFVGVVTEKPGISAEDRILAVSSFSFDIALLETLVSLVFGAQIVILDREQRREPRVILEEIEKRAITVMFATPSHWKMMLEAGWDRRIEGLRLISGGEPLESGLVQRLLPLGAELWNVYGPTETTVYATIKRVRDAERNITVGKPVTNTEVHIVDGNGNPLPKGRKGEVWIAGYGVGTGYLNQPELNRERFVEKHLEGGLPYRVYKTGDLGWINAANELVISGRMDHQVKIRGHRIELAEVESGLRQLEGVREGVVLLRRGPHEQDFLQAFLVPVDNDGMEHGEWKYPGENQIRQWKQQLGKHLTEVMIPTQFLWVKDFPLSENGKVNRSALPDPGSGTVSSSEASEALNPEEKLVAEIWKKALGLNRIHKTDNFFEIGGHSLTAVKVMVQLEKVYGIRLPLSVLFKYPTVQYLSRAIKSGVLGDSEWKSLVAIKNTGSKPPLYIVHGGGLNILPFYAVAREMDREQPVFGIQAKGLDGVEEPLRTVEAIASQYLSEVLQQNPNGPYLLAGYSLGGIIAYEMASQLRKMGKSVEKLVLFDTYAFQSNYRKPFVLRILESLRYFFGKRIFDVELLFRHPSIFRRIKKASWERKVRKVRKLFRPEQDKAETSLLKTYKRVEFVYKEACKEYQIKRYEGPVDLIKARIAASYLPDKENFGWKPYVRELRVWEADGEHITMLSPPNDASFAGLLQQILDKKK
ncbi:amino acid adenylation domain-containing protein [Cyclobacterium xiamenense]|uniref:amino acid adenylation domain-containing protein n=1 Tax=Cyclobacterium xiamenense TaxID=1297121 RepID=UPI0035D0BA85